MGKKMFRFFTSEWVDIHTQGSRKYRWKTEMTKRERTEDAKELPEVQTTVVQYGRFVPNRGYLSLGTCIVYATGVERVGQDAAAVGEPTTLLRSGQECAWESSRTGASLKSIFAIGRVLYDRNGKALLSEGSGGDVVKSENTPSDLPENYVLQFEVMGSNREWKTDKFVYDKLDHRLFMWKTVESNVCFVTSRKLRYILDYWSQISCVSSAILPMNQAVFQPNVFEEGGQWMRYRRPPITKIMDLVGEGQYLQLVVTLSTREWEWGRAVGRAEELASFSTMYSQFWMFVSDLSKAKKKPEFEKDALSTHRKEKQFVICGLRAFCSGSVDLFTSLRTALRKKFSTRFSFGVLSEQVNMEWIADLNNWDYGTPEVSHNEFVKILGILKAVEKRLYKDVNPGEVNQRDYFGVDHIQKQAVNWACYVLNFRWLTKEETHALDIATRTKVSGERRLDCEGNVAPVIGVWIEKFAECWVDERVGEPLRIEIGKFFSPIGIMEFRREYYGRCASLYRVLCELCP